MKLMLFVSALFLSIACSHHHNKVAHHHHQYDKKCAYEVSRNKLNVNGNPEIYLEHDGKVYYFSSLEKKKEFEKNLYPNIHKSKENWEKGMIQGSY